MPSERPFAAASQIGPHTWAEFLALDEDDRRELIEGELRAVDVPTYIHGKRSRVGA
jgi:Uma2 family endonuclease